MAARVLAKHHLVLAETNRLRQHDLVRGLVLQHTVLVDTRLVGEGVGADNGLVGLDGHARVVAHHAAAARNLRRVNARVHGEVLRASLERHHQLLQGRVTGTLTDTVDRDLHLTSSALHSGQSVGRGQTQVVVAVRGEDGLVAALRVLDQVAEERSVLSGHRVADRVGDVERGGAGLDDLGEHLAQEVGVTASGVLRGELDVRRQALGELDGVHGATDALVARDLELVLEVDVGRGQERVDAVLGRVLHGVVAALDVLLHGARETADGHGLARGAVGRERADLLGDGRHGVEVAGRRDGKPASHTSTPSALRPRAMSNFSLKLSVAPGDCSPSRSVVSKIARRSLPASAAAAFEKARRAWARAVTAERLAIVCITLTGRGRSEGPSARIEE